MELISITGASGFVGENLLSYLKSHQLNSRRITRGQLTGTEELTLDGTRVIVHLAGKAHDLKKSSSPEEYYQVNFELTKQLYDAFLVSGAEKFIFISSVKAARDSVASVLTENDAADPQTDYGKSKLMAEQYIRSVPLPEGKTYYILRPCMIHGPGNKGNLNLLYQFVKKGIPYPLAGFSNKRSFLSVENLCFVIKELALRNDVKSGIYQVSDDEALSTNAVITILSDSLDRKAKLWKISPSLIRILSRIGDKLHLPLTTERLKKLTESYVVSNEKLISAIGKPMPVSTRDGLKLTAVSFQNPVK